MSLVSVIIPTFNRKDTIIRAVSSVLSQNYDELECIVVDDASTDETLEVLSRIQDSRLSIVSLKENKGVSAARNIGFDNSSGDFIALLDSDDEWHKDKLSKQVPLLKKYSLVHGEEIWVRNGKKINQKKIHQKSGGSIFERCLHLCLISPSATLMTRSLYNQMKGFREDFPVCEDYELWLRVTKDFDVGFVSDPVITKYGGHDDQLSQKFKAMDYWRIKAMYELYLKSELSESQLFELKNVLLKKCKILRMGYIKHNNTKNIPYLDQIINEVG